MLRYFNITFLNIVSKIHSFYVQIKINSLKQFLQVVNIFIFIIFLYSLVPNPKLNLFTLN